VDRDGTVRIERAVTTYQTNAYGLEDVSYLDVTTPATLSYIRYVTRVRITTKFPRHKLADDGTRFGPGQAIATPSIVRAELLALFRELEERGLVEGFEQFKAELIVERNADDPNRLDVLAPPNIVNQLRVFAEQIQFIL
jgi:phage tail sheath gpL-like